MADLSNILAALAAQRQGGAPSQAPPPPLPGAPYPPPQYAAPPGSAPPYGLPQPINSGSVDLASIKPVSSGSVSIADAIAKARGIAAEKGLSYDPSRPPINIDSRSANRGYRRSRSPSRSPPRMSREGYRDNYNPYRDERRGNERGFTRERSFSPRGGLYSPRYRDDRSPGQDRGAGAGASTGAEGESEIIPLDKSLVGLIIGRSGENLRRVESTTGARVQFMDGPEVAGTQRHCRISGGRSSRAAAKTEIFKIIEDNEAAKRGGDKSRNQSNKAVVLPTKEGDSLQLLVPDRTVGLIIGRGGETIRDLQDRSGCHVNIVGENKSINGMRPVNLIGSPSAQQYARDLILEIVESDQKGISVKDLHRDREDIHGKINDAIVVPGEAVGMIIGKGGESIREMQNQTGCKINVSTATGRDIEREIGLIGTRHAIDAAKRAIMEKVDTVRARSQARETRDDYTDHYAGQQQQQQQQQPPPGYPPAAAPAVQLGGPPPPAGAADPYAAYGGYQNYLSMWYAAMAAQQQGGQGQGEQR
ncbi:uncharacterized protein A1O9_05546 [Exophiala aquamarina CBS 119918]|uniref:K Homology domain-containing protein n=1 Tax=Exophiala aquamarina CBS 119918 TaxID=1182545 RepID=A0A072PEA9_9EURO|nr:uncharacterized protein A1O9_05546 [Exophiala aquamarina CBS 119918]KEF57628.1 hypothetical protein A1O9_05546 [Exophiala aquamarina CBS 119918]